MSTNEESQRLSRIEDKLDQLTEIVAIQAKHDERITQLAKREQRSEERLNELERTVHRNAMITAIAQWFAAGLIGGLIVWIFRQFPS